jgi:ABC-type antimicrobial peptide transport system permease subunit
VGLTLAGIVIGIAGALEAGRLIESLLYQVPTHDPLSFVSASLVLVLVGAMASYVPALRATRVDPLVVLRCQ